MKYLSTIIALLLTLFGSVSHAQGRNGKANGIIETYNMETGKKVLVAYFSHSGENYAVGNITKGNTRIFAEMIAEKNWRQTL